MITVSIVSHGQGAILGQLLRDLPEDPRIRKLIVTCNLPEVLPFSMPAATPGRDALPNRDSLAVEVIENAVPRGFGANHNAAFERCDTPFFAVLNPDLRLPSNPFPALLDTLESRRAALIAPMILDPAGELEDSARRFPTIGRLFAKLLFGNRGIASVPPAGAVPVDWVAGMFMLFRSDAFAAVGGFDEAYFLYYEDVDLCVRLWRAGYEVLIEPGANAIHAAQRASHRDPRYLRRHVASLLRYLWRYAGRLPRTSP